MSNLFNENLMEQKLTNRILSVGAGIGLVYTFKDQLKKFINKGKKSNSSNNFNSPPPYSKIGGRKSKKGKDCNRQNGGKKKSNKKPSKKINPLGKCGKGRRSGYRCKSINRSSLKCKKWKKDSKCRKSAPKRKGSKKMTVGKVCTSKFNPNRIKMGFCCNKKSKSWQRGYPNRKFCSKKTLNKSRKSRKSRKSQKRK
jgi:hypothetical protein